MRAPEGQPASAERRRDLDYTVNASRRQRIMLTVSPLYASFRLPFRGRPPVPARGGGVGIAAQFQVWRPLGLRVSVSHSVHAAYDEYIRDNDNRLRQAAGRGQIQGTHAGLSATYTFDLGRVITTLDAGAGGLWIRSPAAIQNGQFEGECRSDGSCDTGLTCAADNVCRVGVTPQIHGGFAADVLLGDRFAVGAELRYFALLAQPTLFPVYLIAAARATFRF